MIYAHEKDSSELVGKSTVLMTSCRRRFGSIAGSIIRTKKSEKNVREEPLLNSDGAGERTRFG